MFQGQKASPRWQSATSTGSADLRTIFLCRDQSKKALRGAESFSSWGIDRFADLRTHSFVQGPVKKSASGYRKFFLLWPLHSRRFCNFLRQPFCAGTNQKKRFGVQKVFPLGATRVPLSPETPSTICSRRRVFSLASGGAELPKSRRRNFHLGCPFLNTNVLLKLKVRSQKFLRDHAYGNTWFLEDVMMVAMGMCAGNAIFDGTFGGGISMGARSRTASDARLASKFP